MIKLLVKSSEESREVEFNGEPVTIGRSSENVLKLLDKKASRHHARIEKTDGEYRVFDLGSGNGTKLNGRDVAGSAGLNKGDEIVVGLSTLYVLNLDAPAKAPAASAPPLPVASPAPAPVAAAAPAVAAAPTTSDAPKRGPMTRRATYARSSSSGGLVAVVAVVIIGGAIFFAASRMGTPAASSSAGKPKPAVKKAGPTINEANEAFSAFKLKAGQGASEELLAEADRLSDRYGDIFPDFHKLAAEIRTRRNESLSSKGLEHVKPLVEKAVSEARFGDAIDALKALRGGKDAEEAGKLLVSIEAKVDEEYKVLVDAGAKLVVDKKYEPAADLYRDAAPKFRNTRHYKTVSNKPENLMEMAKAEADAQRMKEARAKAEADAALAKAETPKPAPAPAPEMKPEMPKPAPAPEMKPAPAPEMKPAMPKPAPKPEMKPEMPKPPPPPPPPPMPKEEPKKEDPAAAKEGPKLAIKKPEVLCDVKKTAKGNYCTGCDRMLGPDDVRGGNCKKCDEKPKKIDVCVKRYFQSECEHKKVDDKPVFCCGKVHDFPHEDRAPIAYLCESCNQGAQVREDIKHEAECKNRLSATKICMKSGTEPHAPNKK